MTSWKTPTQEQVDKAVALLAGREEQYRYFFKKLENPLWIKPLRAKGFFQNPPSVLIHDVTSGVRFPVWVESRYISKMAQYEPNIVLEIILATETENPQIHIDFAEAAQKMPAKVAKGIIPKVKHWLRSEYFGWMRILPNELGNLSSHLAKGGEAKEALELMEMLLRRLSKSNEEIQKNNRMLKYNSSDWEYEKIFEVNIKNLAQAAGQDTLEMLCKFLNGSIELSKSSKSDEIEPDNNIWEDQSEYWRPIIEDTPADYGAYSFEEHLTVAIQETAKGLLDEGRLNLSEIVASLKSRKWRIFHRIAINLVRLFPDINPNLSQEVVADRNYFDFPVFHQDYEYALLLQEYFPKLSSELQERVLGWIESPNIERPWLSDPEEKLIWMKRWKVRKLTPIKDWIPARWRAVYEGLVDEVGAFDISSLRKGGIRTVARNLAYESPINDIEIAQMSIDSLITFLQLWAPQKTDPFNESSYEGMERVLEKAVSDNSFQYIEAANRFQHVRFCYIRALVEGIYKALTNNSLELSSLNVVSWEPVFELCTCSIKLSYREDKETANEEFFDTDTRRLRYSIANLIGFVCSDEGYQLSISLREVIWESLYLLTQDLDPTPKRDVSGTGMDPATLSINTVRGEAMHAVLRYALWVRRSFEKSDSGESSLKDGFNAMPEVRTVLDQHLDLGQESSFAIRSVYGQWFPWLALLDEKWTLQNIANIFPQEEELFQYWQAVWNTYIIHCSPYDNVFDLLLSTYRFAIESSRRGKPKQSSRMDPEESLAQHIMTFYWRGKTSLKDSESLINYFYSVVSIRTREKAIEYIGRSLENTKDKIDPDILQRIKTLFEFRLRSLEETSNQRGDEEVLEFQPFGWWFVSSKFEDSWALEMLSVVLELTSGKIEPDHLVIEKLAELSETGYLRTCLQNLEKMIVGDQVGWEIYGWHKEARRILTMALQQNGGDVASVALRVINYLGRQGYHEFRDLITLQNNI